MNITTRYLNIKETSKYTSIPVKTLYEWAGAGKIPSIKIGSRVLFDLHDIDKVMERGKRTPYQSKQSANKIIESMSENKYNEPDSCRTGTNLGSGKGGIHV